MLLRETAIFCYKYCTKSKNTYCGKIEEIMYEKAGGIHSQHMCFNRLNEWIMRKNVTESQNNITNSLTCTEKYQSFLLQASV